MSLHDVTVVSYSRACLRIDRRKRFYFCRRFAYERAECIERQMLFLEKFGGDGVEMIGEVAGKYGS